MTMTDTGVKPIPAYMPPEDGKPRNAVNPIQLSASHFHMAQILATKKCRRLERRRMSD